MKKSPFILLSIVALTGHAQELLYKATPVDTARFTATYRLLYKNHPDNKEYMEDTRIVQIGGKTTKDFSRIVFRFDSLRTEDDRRGADTYSSLSGQPWNIEILNDRAAGISDIKYRLTAVHTADILHYSDSIPTLAWTFTPDSSETVLGYECSEATADFAGRKYSAWFTREIPMPHGPYKFGGLPGLILKIQDSERQFIWEAEGFERSSAPILVYDYGKEQKCTASKAARTIERAFNAPVSTMLASFGGEKGRVMLVDKNGKTRDAAEVKDIPIPYKPLEITSIE